MNPDEENEALLAEIEKQDSALMAQIDAGPAAPPPPAKKAGPGYWENVRSRAMQGLEDARSQFRTVGEGIGDVAGTVSDYTRGAVRAFNEPTTHGPGALPQHWAPTPHEQKIKDIRQRMARSGRTLSDLVTGDPGRGPRSVDQPFGPSQPGDVEKLIRSAGVVAAPIGEALDVGPSWLGNALAGEEHPFKQALETGLFGTVKRNTGLGGAIAGLQQDKTSPTKRAIGTGIDILGNILTPAGSEVLGRKAIGALPRLAERGMGAATRGMDRMLDTRAGQMLERAIGTNARPRPEIGAAEGIDELADQPGLLEDLAPDRHPVYADAMKDFSAADVPPAPLASRAPEPPTAEELISPPATIEDLIASPEMPAALEPRRAGPPAPAVPHGPAAPPARGALPSAADIAVRRSEPLVNPPLRSRAEAAMARLDEVPPEVRAAQRAAQQAEAAATKARSEALLARTPEPELPVQGPGVIQKGETPFRARVEEPPAPPPKVEEPPPIAPEPEPEIPAPAPEPVPEPPAPAPQESQAAQIFNKAEADRAAKEVQQITDRIRGTGEPSGTGKVAGPLPTARQNRTERYWEFEHNGKTHRIHRATNGEWYDYDAKGFPKKAYRGKSKEEAIRKQIEAADQATSPSAVGKVEPPRPLAETPPAEAAGGTAEVPPVSEGPLKPRPGIVAPALLRHAGSTAGGSLIGAALDKEHPGRGATIGGVIGAGGSLAAGRLLGAAAKQGEKLIPEAEEVLSTIRYGERAAGPSIAQKLRKLPGDLYRHTFNREATLEKMGESPAKKAAMKFAVSQSRGTGAAAENQMFREFQPIFSQHKRSGVQNKVRVLSKAERDIELAGRGLEKTGTSLATNQKVVDHYGKDPEVVKAVEELRGLFNRILDMKLQHGLITQDAYDAMKATSQKYIPFTREFEDETGQVIEAIGGGGGMGGDKRLMSGSTGTPRMDKEIATSATVDPYELAARQMMDTHRRIGKQRVTQLFSEYVERNPEEAAKWAKRIAKREDAKSGRLIEPIVNGRKQLFEITDPDVYDAFAGMDEQTSAITKWLSVPGKAVRMGVTLLPDFHVGNVGRDASHSLPQYGPKSLKKAIAHQAGTAAVGAAGGALVDREDPLRGAGYGAALTLSLKNWTPQILRTLDSFRDMSGKLGGNQAMWDEFVQSGGGGITQIRSPKDAQKMVKYLERSHSTVDKLIHPADALGEITHALEMAPRYAYYKHLRKQGKSIPEAIHGGRDVSVDLNKFGKSAKKIAPTTAFWNPAVQGLDKFARMLKDPRTHVAAASAITAPTIALWNINKDDPEYWKRNQWERNAYWLIPKRLLGSNEKGFHRIKKPFEVGYLYASLPERLLDYHYQKDPARLKEAMKEMLGSAGMGVAPIPTGVRPVVEAWANKDRFGSPIVPANEENLPDQFQVGSAPRAAEAISAATRAASPFGGPSEGIAPANVEHLVEGWTGPAGKLAVSAASKFMDKGGRPERPAQPTPVLGTFSTRNDVVTEQEGNVARRLKEGKRLMDGLKAAKAEGREAYRAYEKEHMKELTDYYYLNKRAGEVIKGGKKRRGEIYKARASGESKTKGLTELNDQIVKELIKRGVAPSAHPKR